MVSPFCSCVLFFKNRQGWVGSENEGGHASKKVGVDIGYGGKDYFAIGDKKREHTNSWSVSCSHWFR